ncbi:MAG TPA: NAD(P)-binding protein, partial [Bacteroidota bacterium]|nr:NAD(P)-binding protein [Bacteroidota bacterium]
MENIVILGAGMAGFGAAHRVHSHGLRSTLYEKHPYHGGHTASFTYDAGFLFDEGPHVSFTSDERIQGLLAESVNDRFLTVPYRVNNYWRGHWIKHPAHCNLHGLPPDLVVNILNDFISAQGGEGKNVRNYAEWLIATYGEAFARTFPMEYTKKFHTTTADNMSTEWLGPRMYKPKLDEVIFGCISPKTPDYHYVTEFRYPDRGGFVSYFRTFLNQTDLYLGHELIGVNPKAKELRFANGAVSQYDALISSIPLPELVPLIAGVPADVLNAARRLACSACMLVNIGVNREDISENTVTYFYDQDMIFTRLSFPHLMSRNNVPPGAGSIQAEV